MIGLTLVAQAERLAEPDLAYNLYAAARLLDGARLYRDLVDMNPPLIFLFNLPVAWLARATGLSDFLLYHLATTLTLIALSLFALQPLRQHVLRDRPTALLTVALGLCFVLFPLSGEDFGEREQLVLGLLLPYVALAAGRLAHSHIPRGQALGAGALAGLGLGLKPHFGLALVAVEGWRRLRVAGPDRWGLTPELLGLAGTVGAYLGAIIIWAPDYLTVVRTLGGAYATYLRVPLLNLFVLAPWAPLTAFALLAAIATRRVGPDGEGRGVLAAATIGCFLAGVAQQKGWRYQFYPSFALAVLLLLIVAAEEAGRRHRLARIYQVIARSLAVAVVVVVVGKVALDAAGGSTGDRSRRAEFLDLVETVKHRANGEPIGVLSYHMGSAFPLVNYAHVRLASRFPLLWILPVSYWKDLQSSGPIQYRSPADMSPPERFLNLAVKEDLLGVRPRLLLILRPFPDRPPYGLRRLNYVAYFGRDPQLAHLLRGYQFVVTKGQYDIYERLDPDGSRTGPPPSAGVPALSLPSKPPEQGRAGRVGLDGADRIEARRLGSGRPGGAPASSAHEAAAPGHHIAAESAEQDGATTAREADQRRESRARDRCRPVDRPHPFDCPRTGRGDQPDADRKRRSQRRPDDEQASGDGEVSRDGLVHPVDERDRWQACQGGCGNDDDCSPRPLFPARGYDVRGRRGSQAAPEQHREEHHGERVSGMAQQERQPLMQPELHQHVTDADGEKVDGHPGHDAVASCRGAKARVPHSDGHQRQDRRAQNEGEQDAKAAEGEPGDRDGVAPLQNPSDVPWTQLEEEIGALVGRRTDVEMARRDCAGPSRGIEKCADGRVSRLRGGVGDDGERLVQMRAAQPRDLLGRERGPRHQNSGQQDGADHWVHRWVRRRGRDQKDMASGIGHSGLREGRRRKGDEAVRLRGGPRQVPAGHRENAVRPKAAKEDPPPVEGV